VGFRALRVYTLPCFIAPTQELSTQLIENCHAFNGTKMDLPRLNIIVPSNIWSPKWFSRLNFFIHLSVGMLNGATFRNQLVFLWSGDVNPSCGPTLICQGSFNTSGCSRGKTTLHASGYPDWGPSVSLCSPVRHYVIRATYSVIKKQTQRSVASSWL
jgi:hypothetical protein